MNIESGEAEKERIREQMEKIIHKGEEKLVEGKFISFSLA